MRVGGVGSESKQVDVTYDPAKVSLQQLVTAVAAAEPVHNKPYQGWLVVTIEDPKSATKLTGALKRVKGVVDVKPTGIAPGEVGIAIAPLQRNAKPADHVKASQIADALEKAGVKFSGLEVAGGGGAPSGESDKKKPGEKGTAKPKPGDDAPEKSKPSRAPSITPKTKQTRDSATARHKEDDADEKPRFEVLGGGGGKVYIIDHETKNDDGKELKKLVKAGDKFGDYVVREAGDDDGLFVVLEHADTKELIRVEHEKKDKEKAGEKGKSEKDNDAKTKGGPQR